MSSDEEGYAETPYTEQMRSLFCNKMFSSAREVFEDAKNDHGFNFHHIKKTLGLDFYGCIRMLNFVRTRAQEGIQGPVLSVELLKDTSVLNDEKWLKPAIPNDPLLFEFDNSEDPWSDEDEEGKPEASQSSLQKENDVLRAENRKLLANVEEMTAIFQRITGDQGREVKIDMKPDDDYYFATYSGPQIHETMLRDTVRTGSYRDFMYKNKKMFEGKTVLDIGCGTGILSLFAARAGAKRVIGIDRAEVILKAQQIVKDNNLDSVITLIKGRVEEVSLPSDVKQVDIIISEWMGYMLLYESMCSTVLHARDKWLAPGGLVHPDKASLYLAGFDARSLKQEREDFWKDVYEFDMSAMLPKNSGVGFAEIIEEKDVVTDFALLKEFDINSIKDQDLDFDCIFTLTARKLGVVSGLAFYFDIAFDKGCTEKIRFSTGPHSEPTHWKQTIFYLADSIQLKKDDLITCTLIAKRSIKHHRGYDLKFLFRVNDGEEVEQKLILS